MLRIHSTALKIVYLLKQLFWTHFHWISSIYTCVFIYTYCIQICNPLDMSRKFKTKVSVYGRCMDYTMIHRSSYYKSCYREQQTGSLICPSNFALSSADAQFMPRLGHGTGSWSCCRHHICALDLTRVIVDAEKWCCLIQRQSHGAKKWLFAFLSVWELLSSTTIQKKYIYM